MDLDVRRLRVLREVALRGTVTAAAESLGFTPSAVSQQLSALERESGVMLLERAGRRVRLTDAGQVLVQRTEPVLAALEAAQAALEESRDSPVGELRIAAAGSIAKTLVIPVVAQIAVAQPALRATVLECETGDSMRELRLGHLDVVVAHEYSSGPRRLPEGAARVDLFTEQMCVAAPTGRYAAPVDLATLAGEVWAAEPPQSTCGWATRAACRSAGFDPDIRYVSSEPGVLLSAVRCAGAVALLPRLAVAEPPPGVDVLPVAGAGVHRVVYAAHRRGSASRPGVALILARLKAAAGELCLPVEAVGNPRPDRLLSPPHHRGSDTLIRPPLLVAEIAVGNPLLRLRLCLLAWLPNSAVDETTQTLLSHRKPLAESAGAVDAPSYVRCQRVRPRNADRAGRRGAARQAFWMVEHVRPPRRRPARGE